MFVRAALVMGTAFVGGSASDTISATVVSSAVLTSAAFGFVVGGTFVFFAGAAAVFTTGTAFSFAAGAAFIVGSASVASAGVRDGAAFVARVALVAGVAAFVVDFPVLVAGAFVAAATRPRALDWVVAWAFTTAAGPARVVERVALVLGAGLATAFERVARVVYCRGDDMESTGM